MGDINFQQYLNKDKEEHIVEYLNLTNHPKPTLLKRIDEQAKGKITNIMEDIK